MTSGGAGRGTDGTPDADAARIATEVLGAHGQHNAAVERGGGWTNATWMTADLVVRVAHRAGPADLLREAALAEYLPPETGYPVVVASGVLDGHEWVLTRRIPGENLEDVWPRLTGQQRAVALEQVWTRVESVHALRTEAVAMHARPRSPFYAESAAEATATLERLNVAGLLTDDQVPVLAARLERFWATLPRARTVLNHGDLGMCNALWHDGAVTAVYDFEFAVLAPVEVDLNEILKFAFAAPNESPEVREAALRIARPTLDRGGGTDVLLGYAVQLEAWLLENELTTDPATDPTTAESYRLLTGLAKGDNGHLAPVTHRR